MPDWSIGRGQPSANVAKSYIAESTCTRKRAVYLMPLLLSRRRPRHEKKIPQAEYSQMEFLQVWC